MATAVKTLSKQANLRQQIIEYHELCQQIKLLQDKRKSQGGKLVKELGPHGVMQFQIADDILLKATVVQAHRRTIPWKDLAYRLAKRLYPGHASLRRWLRGIAKKYPKKPCEAYLLVTPTKEAA